jgi:hypothetical protein
MPTAFIEAPERFVLAPQSPLKNTANTATGRAIVVGFTLYPRPMKDGM